MENSRNISRTWWDLTRKILKWRRIKFVVIPLVAMAALIAICDNVVMPWYVKKGQEVEVPNVCEMSFEEARDILQRQGFQIIQEGEQFDSQYPSGYVLTQNPPAFAKVKKGRRVYVVVSKGERTVKMPNLIGRSERDAKFILNNLGLTLDDITYEHSAYYPEGVVCDQSITRDRELKLGTGVDIVVSMGRFPDRFIVPELIGKSLTEAKKIIKKAGLNLGNISYQVEPKLLPETVLNQSLPANTEVSMGDTLDLLISTLPEQVPEPE